MLRPGPLLKRARQTAGLTQVQLAERLHTSQPVVARLESGRSNPRVDTLRKAIVATGHELEAHLVPSTYPPIDETLIVGSLERSPADRLRWFQDAYGGARSIARAARLGDGP